MRNTITIRLLLVLLLASMAIIATAACSKHATTAPTSGSLSITSPAFSNHGDLPSQYTCDGEGISPALTWSGVPDNTQSLVLIVDDPDAPDPKAPQKTWVHWILYNLPPKSASLAQNIQNNVLPDGTREGNNSWHKARYGAPCPPIGTHRYMFTLYALDTTLSPSSPPSETALQKAMDGHILAQARLVGRYQKAQ